MSVREYECVPCVRDRVNKIETQCDSRHARTARTTHARTLMVTQIRSELKSTVCYRLAGTSDNICKLREAVDDVTRILAALSQCCLNRHNVFLVTKMAANLHV